MCGPPASSLCTCTVAQMPQHLHEACVTGMQDVYEPTLKRIIPYMFCIGIVGIFMLVIMRKRFIIDYRLHFPSGTATGILISGFHTPKGEAQARAQVGFGSRKIPEVHCWALHSSVCLS